MSWLTKLMQKLAGKQPRRASFRDGIPMPTVQLRARPVQPVGIAAADGIPVPLEGSVSLSVVLAVVGELVPMVGETDGYVASARLVEMTPMIRDATP